MTKLALVLGLLLVGCRQEPVTAPVSSTSSAPSPTVSPSPSSSTAPAPASSNARDKPKSLFVNSKMVDCEGEGPMKCMQVRESESAEWQLFYTGIEGFKFEEGNKYELRVVETAPYKFKLVEVVSKKADK